jgi:hypothetical protein
LVLVALRLVAWIALRRIILRGVLIGVRVVVCWLSLIIIAHEPSQVSLNTYPDNH